MAFKEYSKLGRLDVRRFYGVNRHETGRAGGDGSADAYDMLEITADEFPTAKVRKARKEILFPVGGKKKDVAQATVGTSFKIMVQQDADLADVVQVSLPFVAQDGFPDVTEWFDVDVSTDGIYTVYTFLDAVQGKKAVREATRIINGGNDAQIIGRWMGTTPGGVTDACTIGDQIYLATEDGSVVGNTAILQTYLPIKQIVPMGRRLFTVTGYLIDEGLTAAQATAVKLPATGTLTATVALVNEESATITPATSKPADPQNGDYWYDSVTKGLYRYSTAQDMWTAVTECYIQITYGSAQTALGNLKEGDAVRITINGAVTSSVIRSVTDTVLTVRGMTEDTGSQTVIVERRMPVLDFICEHNNRMWGVRYGENDDGKFVNEIYCSAQGDPTNWLLYEGTAHDAWTASVGAPGPWTGITECGEYVYAFKADRVFVITGSTPATFNYKKIDDWGVQPDSEKSICVIDNYCYYKSEHGIMRIGQYSYPVCISRALGADVWKEAIAGTDGRKYYISMREDIFLRSMYVYDTESGIWTQESEPVTGLRTFLRYQNNLMAIGLKRQLNGVTTGCRISYSETKDAEDDATGETKIALRAYSRMLTVITPKQAGALLEKTTPGALAEYVNGASTIYCTAATVKACIPMMVWVSDERTEAAAAADGLQIASIGMSGFDVSTWETGKAETVTEKPRQWYYETLPMGLEWPDEKRVLKIQIRVKAPRETKIRVKAAYDEQGQWEEIAHRTGTDGTYRIAYTPAQRCDTFRLRIEGTGDAVIYGVYITMEDGGDYAD